MKRLARKIRNIAAIGLGILALSGCTQTSSYMATTLEEIANNPGSFNNGNVVVTGQPIGSPGTKDLSPVFIIQSGSYSLPVTRGIYGSIYTVGDYRTTVEAINEEIRDQDNDPIQVVGEFDASKGVIEAHYIMIDGNFYPYHE